MSVALHHVSGFTFSSPVVRNAATSLDASRNGGVVLPVEPRTQTSEAKRQQAYSAMNRQKVESALNGVDAHMLELLSEQFLYPSATTNVARKRPKGRPEYVPGAMNYDTMVKFRERQVALDLVAGKTDVSDAEIAAIAPYIDNVEEGSTTKSRPPAPRRRKKSRGVKGATIASNGESSTSSRASAKKRKRVVKNLPKPNSGTEKAALARLSRKAYAKKGKNPNGMDLHKYYRTDLLTSEEEYSLGMKIQFMVKCEQVHEGLSAKLVRLPTMQEWAEACGFTDPDPTFVQAEADELLRPVGSATMFQKTDPNMFVGNGLAIEAGPGRGRGRAKKPPPLTLGDFYDDSELRKKSKTKDDTDGPVPSEENLKPINRGTVTDFVEMMMTAREAKQQMVQSNMRLVVSIARKYSNVGVGLQDLVQEGSLGLSRAAEKFKPKKGFKFSTYASWWIQQAVFRSIAYQSRTIRLPVHIHNLLNRVRKVRNALQSELGRSPTNDEVAEQLGMTTEKYNKMLRLTKRSISLEVPKYQSNPKDLGHESDDLLGDTIASSTLEDDTTPEKKVDHGLFHEDLKEMLTILEEDERRVISARYGLADGLMRTVTAVAAQMKQSKAWVRSQECRALRKLRRPWYEKKLKEHQDALSN